LLASMEKNTNWKLSFTINFFINVILKQIKYSVNRLGFELF